MITQKAYALLNKYAKKLARKPQDADDIFQEAMVLFYENPIGGILSKKLLYRLVKLGMLRFYYNFDRINKDGKKGSLRNQEVLLDKFNEVALALPEEYDLENIVLLNEFRRKVTKIEVKEKSHTLALSFQEKKVLDSILYDKELDMKSNLVSAHRGTLISKLKKFL